MCRVIGITNFDWSRHGDIVARFTKLAHTGLVLAEDPPGHMDGWGLAFYQNGTLAVHKSGACILDEADRVFGILGAARTSPLMILHMRKSAWANTSSTRHAHPFHLGNTVFFHNGVVYDYHGLLPDITFPGLGADARDTEVFFYHVMSGKGPDPGRKFLDSVAQIRRNHRYSALNCLFSDGVKLFAYRDYAREPAYYSLFKAQADTSRFISSEPLGEDMGWETMAQEEFLEVELATKNDTSADKRGFKNR